VPSQVYRQIAAQARAQPWAGRVIANIENASIEKTMSLFFI
jgi:hypothetical protein